jgi:hypothetical protein
VMIQCVSAVCVLGIVILGMLIMTQIVSLEEVAKGIGRGLLLILIAAVLLCTVKTLLMVAATAVLSFLRHLIVWLAIVALVILGVIVVTRILISKLETRLSGKGNHQRGEL